ncbi:unnamed protein product [Paramecium pentaurelia]|uniref:Transmembrane protein n=1 Tax=Paramecium pentaurelia TaxID=43138 RepID=A0A8S1YPR7_9CILI|nr:unnamed protein product [Paramecium pentaurelia]
MKQTISFPFLIVICFEIQTYLCWSITILPTFYSYKQFEVKQSNSLDGESACFGVWSKYVPLSNIVQTGEYGILYSSCFHQFRIQKKVDSNVYFLYFECISFEEKMVKKYFQFLDSDNRVTTEQISIDLISYEGVRYFNGFLASPLEKRVTIYIQDQQMNQIFSKDVQIRFPFQENIFTQIIGGDFKVEQTSKFYLFENKILSYFPGQIYYLQNCFYDIPDQFFELIQSRQQKPCNCKNNQITDLPHVKIQNQDIYEFLSQNTNCQQFHLAGWIKNLEINKISNEFQFLLFKLMGNFQHPQLIQENLCAFQLLYKLSTQINQIILTTYSYTLPVVNIDFSTNPYLKKVEFDVTNDIQLWHYILVEKSDQFISITITFYQGQTQEKFSLTQEVVQFQMDFNDLIALILIICRQVVIQHAKNLMVQQKMIVYHVMNFQIEDMYQNLKFVYVNMELLIRIMSVLIIKHYNQIKLKSSNLINNVNMGFLKLMMIALNGINNYKQQCIFNPKSWIHTLLCQTSLLVHQDGSVTKYFEDENLQYLFAGDELIYCPNCDLNVKAPYDLIEASLIVKNLCSVSQSINENCYLCINDCKKCAILPTTELCLDRTPNASFANNTCYAPNYLNFYKKCVTCKLENCQYCFDYLASDPTKSTLENLESFSLNDEEIKLGCAQCREGYIFEFTTSTCINQKPTQQNCLRSYINLEEREICTLSNDFTLSFEKINCQDLILHCKQCIKTIQTTIKCLICEDGYIVSSITGVCSICPIFNSKQCQQDNLLEPGKWQFQGFVIQFLPPKTRINYDISRPNTIVIECLQGYRILENECQQYCDEFCSVCETVKQLPFSKFQCSQCKRNYYKELIRVQADRKCIECPSLCQVCLNRSTNEINKNSIYTFRCIQKVPFESKIHIDPILAIAQYCYQDNCNYKLEFIYVLLYQITQDEVECFNINDFKYIQYNYKYLNEIGLKYIPITINLELYCNFGRIEYILMNSFKENIISIRLSELIIKGSINPIIFNNKVIFQVQKYDQIVISNAIFLILFQIEMILRNRGQSINFYILNTKFYSNQSYPIIISINADSFQQFNMQNFTISDISIGNSIIFDIFCEGLNEDITINNIKLQDCKIINSTLFYFQNVNRNIFIKNFTIDSCIFIFKMNQNSISNVFLNELVISNCLFQNSKLIYSLDTTTLNINNLSIINNQILSSQFIVFNYNFYCNDIMIIDNYFLQLQLIAQIQSIQSIIEIQMKNLYIKNNHLTNFSVFITQQKQLFNNIDFLLLNFNFEDNTPSYKNENILITINCVTLLIKNFFLKNTTNFRFLFLLDIPYIQIDNQCMIIQFRNIKCLIKLIAQEFVFLSHNYCKFLGLIELLFRIYNVDLSLVSIYSNPLNTSNQNEYIYIKHSIMKGNILLKQNLGILFSLMEFYSKNQLYIAITKLTFEENIFHQYQTDPSQTQASLMYFDTKQSIIILKDILCIYNSLTNSTQSFLSISSDEVQLENITVLNHNWLNKEFWIKYYDILFQGEYNENEISYAIQQSFKIQNIGGIFSMFVTKFTINKGFFSYIQAESNSIFNIYLQGEGIGIIKNCSIIHAQNSLISNYENDGAITINGRKSLLKIILENITLEHVYNKLLQSFFLIYPSLKQNNIKFLNIIVKNCFSLVNSIINFQSEFQNADKNKIYIENLNIVQNEQALLIFLHSIGKISSLEFQKVIDDNAMMNFLGCQIQLIGL